MLELFYVCIKTSSHALGTSSELMQTWGVDGPGDEREDTMISPTQESDDVLREVV